MITSLKWQLRAPGIYTIFNEVHSFSFLDTDFMYSLSSSSADGLTYLFAEEVGATRGELLWAPTAASTHLSAFLSAAASAAPVPHAPGQGQRLRFISRWRPILPVQVQGPAVPLLRWVHLLHWVFPVSAETCCHYCPYLGTNSLLIHFQPLVVNPFFSFPL